MARKKIIFVIVEGPSDEEALGVILSRVFDRSQVYVHILHCDITTERGTNVTNILSKVGNEIKGFMVSNRYRPNDFKRIIHIVDTDGAYVNNSCVVADLNHPRPYYTPELILTANKQGIERRNQQKSTNLSKLFSCSSIRGVPYQVFYMSSNLDHVLYDRQNSDDDEKERNSLQFAKAYRDDVAGFLNWISCSDFSVMTGYYESWDYIKQSTHSLERHTNIGLGLGKDR